MGSVDEVWLVITVHTRLRRGPDCSPYSLLKVKDCKSWKTNGEVGERKEKGKRTGEDTCSDPPRDTGADQLAVSKPGISLLTPPATQTPLLDVRGRDTSRIVLNLDAHEHHCVHFPFLTPCWEQAGHSAGGIEEEPRLGVEAATGLPCELHQHPLPILS